MIKNCWQHARELGFIALAVCACSALLSCETKTCTLIGCINGAHIQVTLATAYQDLQSLNITVCHNDICLQGELERPDAGDFYRSRSTVFPGWGSRPAQVEALLEPIDAHSAMLDLTWESTVAGDLVDGDTFSVTVTEASGKVLASGEKAVTYARNYPNGKDCDHIPCLNAQVTVDATGTH